MTSLAQPSKNSNIAFGRRLPYVAAALLCFVSLASVARASEPIERIVLQVDSGNAPKASIMRQDADVIRIRLDAAGIPAAVMVMPKRRLAISIYGSSPFYLRKLVSLTGRISFKALPSGDKYEADRPIKAASLGKDLLGNVVLYFVPSNRAAFYHFTATHVNQDLGLFLDGKLLVSPHIVNALKDVVQIGNLNEPELRFVYAFMQSGPLVAPVSIVSF